MPMTSIPRTDEKRDALLELETLLEQGDMARADERARFGNDLDAAQQTLQDVRPHVTSILALAEATLRVLPMLTLDQRAQVQTIAHDLTERGAILAKAQTSSELQLIPHRLKGLDKLGERLHVLMSQAWEARLAAEFDHALQLLGVLEACQVAPEPRGQLQTLKKQVQALRYATIPTDQDLENLGAACQQREKALQALESAGLDDDILTVLQKVVRKEASLSDLTPEVLKWLIDSGAAERIRLTF